MIRAEYQSSLEPPSYVRFLEGWAAGRIDSLVGGLLQTSFNSAKNSREARLRKRMDKRTKKVKQTFFTFLKKQNKIFT